MQMQISSEEARVHFVCALIAAKYPLTDVPRLADALQRFLSEDEKFRSSPAGRLWLAENLGPAQTGEETLTSSSAEKSRDRNSPS